MQLTHVPYGGASNQLLDVIGGNIEMTFVSLAGARQFVSLGLHSNSMHACLSLYYSRFWGVRVELNAVLAGAILVMSSLQ